MSEFKWQPIETAPKDGTVIDLYRPKPQSPWRHQCRVSGWWDVENQTWVWPSDMDQCAYSDFYCGEEDKDVFESNDFTHWMPVPSPPEAQP